MGKRVYEEENINNIALAIQRLTGITEQFTVADMPEIIDTYMNPKDMTNVRKFKLTFKSAFPWSSSGMGLGSIRFKNSITDEYYQYLIDDVGTSTVKVNYGSIQNIMQNTTVSNCQFLWDDITLPFNIIIEFPHGIDLTYYDVLELYPDLNKVAYGPPAIVNISVLTGDPGEGPEIYTSLYNNLSLTDSWVYDTLNPVKIDIAKDNKYRYLKLIIRNNRYGDVDNQYTKCYSSLFSYKDELNVDHYLYFTGQETGSTNCGTISAANPAVLLAKSETQGEPYSGVEIKRDNADTNYPYILIDLHDNILDLNIYNHLKLTNSGDGYGLKRMPTFADVLVAKEPDFILPKVIFYNVALFDGEAYHNTTLYESDI